MLRLFIESFRSTSIISRWDFFAQLRGGAPPGPPPPLPDTAETVHISSLALLKMLKHGRAGVPMEVMGLMLGSFVDDYTVQVVDVFAMPQSGTGVSVEAVDPVFQTKMLDMLKLTGRPETVVGWYHSHPGFGCWLSGTDCNTQQSFEQLHKRSVAVVIDPIQSVKGKVVIDAFRLMGNPQVAMLGMEPRQSTSVVGHLKQPSIQALVSITLLPTVSCISIFFRLRAISLFLSLTSLYILFCYGLSFKCDEHFKSFCWNEFLIHYERIMFDCLFSDSRFRPDVLQLKY